MPDRPTAAELAEALQEFLEREILPVLGILRRDLGAPGDDLSPAQVEELARRIRAGDPPPDALALLKRPVAAKLRVASPRYLDR